MIRKHYRLTGLALALVICALAIPATAVAQSNDGGYTSANAITGASSEQSQPTGGYSSPNAITGGAQLRRPVSPPPALPHGVGYSAYDVGTPSTPPAEVPAAPVVSNPGFDWGDAGIGAGAGFALTMIGLGGLLVLSTRRDRVEPSAPTA